METHKPSFLERQEQNPEFETSPNRKSVIASQTPGMPLTSKFPQEVGKLGDKKHTPVISKSKISSAITQSIVTAEDQNSKLKGKRIFLKDS